MASLTELIDHIPRWANSINPEATIRIDDLDLREIPAFHVRVLARLEADHDYWDNGLRLDDIDEAHERARLTPLDP